MRLKKVWCDKSGIVRAIIDGDSNEDYHLCVDTNRNLNWCTCPYNVFTTETCKHIKYLKRRVNLSNCKDRRNNLENLKSDCGIIDELLGGGFPYGITTAVIGEPEVGKTFLTAQLALANIAQTGKNSLIIDTEGYRKQDYVDAIAGKMLDRFELSKKDLDKRLKFYSVVSDWDKDGLQKLCELFGYELHTTIKKPTKKNKGAKIQVHFIPCKPELSKNLLNNTTFIALDSLTAPIKYHIGSEQQNLPARSQVEERIFGRTFMLADTFNAAVVVNHHVSINPQNPRDLGIAYGGRDVLYNSKYGIQIMQPNKSAREKFGNEARRVMQVRVPGVQKSWEKYPMRLKYNYGFTDQTDEELNEDGDEE